MPQANEAQPRRTLTGAAFVGGLLLYGLTCAPGVLWQDSAMFQSRIWYGDLSGGLGLPLAHPLYILLAKLFCALPLGNYAFRVNLFSAVCAAATLAVAMDLLLALTRSRSAAAISVVLLAVSHTFWAHAVIAEVYSLYALALVLELRLIECFVRRRQARWLVLACLVNGLNVSNHLLALLHWPAYLGLVIWALRHRWIRPAHMPLLIGVLLCGTAAYSGLVISEIARGRPVAVVLKEALVGPPQWSRLVLGHSFPFARMAARSFEYFALNFPTPLVLAAPLGVWLGWKQPATRWFVAVAAAIFAVGSVFAFRYQVPDQYVFFMPCYVLVPLLAGLAIPWLTAKGRFLPAICLLCAVMPAAVYEAAPPLLKRMTVNLPTRNIPYRDTYGYFIRPRKNGDDGAQRFAREALARAGPDGLLLADSTIGHVLTYVRDVEGVERNVVLSGSEMRSAPPRIPPDDAAAIHRFAERGRAFICSASPGYVPPWIKAEYDLVPVDVIFRLVPKPSGTKPSSQDAPD